MKPTHADNRGFSLAEVTVILGTLSVLTAAISPGIVDYVNDARHIKAQSDVRVIASSLARFAFDVGAQAKRPGGFGTLEVLVGSGRTPAVADGGDARWAIEVDGTSAGWLDDHLVTNKVAYERTPFRTLAARGWSGPYIEAGAGADPWGNRYAVNVGSFAAGDGADIVVLSAGPNGTVDTPFKRDGLAPGGDDIIGLIGSGGR